MELRLPGRVVSVGPVLMANIGWPGAAVGNVGKPGGPPYTAALAEVRRAVAEGARMVDIGRADASRVAAVHACEPDVIVCADAAGADMTRDAAIAARSGAALLLDSPPAAPAAGSWRTAGTTVITAALADAAPLAGTGWPVLVDVDADELAASVAVAAVCVWLGVTILRTRRVSTIRQAVEMVEAIRGTRAPFWTRRGLA